MWYSVFYLKLLDEIEKQLRFEAVHVNFPEPPFHSEEIYLVLRVGQVPYRSGQAIIFKRFDCSDITLGIDCMRPDESLTGWPMRHPIGKRAGY